MQNLVYRFNMIIGFVSSILVLLIFRHVWISLYSQNYDPSLPSLQQALTYSTFSILIIGLYPNELIRIVGEKVRTGNIIFEITRPIHFIKILLYEIFGKIFAQFISTFLPLLLLSIFIFKLEVPNNFSIWLTFSLSFLLGLIIAFQIDFIFSILSFWTTGIHGILLAKQSLVSLLSGAMLPLWVFPDFINKILFYSPFPSIVYNPLSIIVNDISMRDIWLILSMQFFWIMILSFLSMLLYKRAVNKLILQGG